MLARGCTSAKSRDFIYSVRQHDTRYCRRDDQAMVGGMGGQAIAFHFLNGQKPPADRPSAISRGSEKCSCGTPPMVATLLPNNVRELLSLGISIASQAPMRALFWMLNPRSLLGFQTFLSCTGWNPSSSLGTSYLGDFRGKAGEAGGRMVRQRVQNNPPP
jgi:hypothetical protein